VLIEVGRNKLAERGHLLPRMRARVTGSERLHVVELRTEPVGGGSTRVRISAPHRAPRFTTEPRCLAGMLPLSSRDRSDGLVSHAATGRIADRTQAQACLVRFPDDNVPS
jgi:hypothetical protein